MWSVLVTSKPGNDHLGAKDFAQISRGPAIQKAFSITYRAAGSVQILFNFEPSNGHLWGDVRFLHIVHLSFENVYLKAVDRAIRSYADNIHGTIIQVVLPGHLQSHGCHMASHLFQVSVTGSNGASLIQPISRADKAMVLFLAVQTFHACFSIFY